MSQGNHAERQPWPEGLFSRVPYWVFKDPDVFELEQERIHRGPAWSFLCLEAELPAIGDFKTTFLGKMPVVVARDTDGSINAFENRCSHRGALLCIKQRGNAQDFTCVYHAWRHDLKGNLQSVAFMRGVKGKGGMPADFKLSDHGPRKLRVETFAGLVFGTLSTEVSDLPTYLGPEIGARIRRVLCKPLQVLGTYTQILPNNWKLYFENTKDTYHSSLLHTFFGTFKVSRLSQPGAIRVANGHHVGYTLPHPGGKDHEFDKESLRSNQEGKFGLEDPRLLEVRDEFGDGCNVQLLSVFPGFVLQHIHNTLACRQILPVTIDRTHLVWTLIGFTDDDPALRELRMKHANLVGPAGYVSMEDGAVGGFIQRGIAGCTDEAALVQMGGHGTESQDTRTTESALRGFWKAYRSYMEI
ncbi:MAG: Rieske 2Fe-2S domain-containing protein [Lautropia sp.]